jgi:hypothetical protein
MRMISSGTNERRCATAAAFAAILCLAGCNESAADPKTQIGATPDLPPPQQYLLPPMHIASAVGWKPGEKPTVAAGLQIKALAAGFQHPPSLYVLSNGDVLVVESKAAGTEPIKRPKDFIMKWVESWATSGGNTGEGNRITL